jgi:hypothetical protein
MPALAIQTKRWTRQGNERPATLGFNPDERVKLLNGEIVTMTPRRSLHSAGIGLAAALRRAFGQALNAFRHHRHDPKRPMRQRLDQ